MDMKANTSMEKTDQKAGISTLEILVRTAGFLVVIAAILFSAAGRLDWGAAWAYVGVMGVFAAITLLITFPGNPGMADERAGRKAGAVILWPVTLLVAGLDARNGWPPAFALPLQWGGLVILVLASVLSAWAMISNTFYSRYVRIQEDRGHTVVNAGPYRFVRHPGYAGFIGGMLATPFLLGSWWAMLPAGLMACALVFRTALEDRTLRRELDGYSEYATQVRYRLLPGVW
jgi:protein-S-isoprenylcysteine O-methyltransferase Ste14